MVYMEIKKSIEQFFNPHFDELTMFATGYSLILLITSGIIKEWKTISFSIDGDNPFIYILVLMLFIGLFLTIYHAFSNREKTLLEKKAMVLFMGIINGATGIWGGYYILLIEKEVLIVFPILNFISGAVLLGGLRSGNINEDNIDDENASIKQVVLSTIIVSTVFVIFHFIFESHWLITLTACVSYATNFNKKFNGLLLRANNLS